MLIIHLKRFWCNGNVYKKLLNKVEFPIEELDLSEFVVSSQKSEPHYTLFAVVQHQGKLSSGHYTASCKNRKNMEWYLYNDDLVFNVWGGEGVKL